MALTDGNGNDMVMPVGPLYGGGGNGFGNGFGGDWAWIILLLLLAGGNGWGGGFGGGGYAGEFPWLMTGQQNINANTNNGFRDAMLNDGINGIRDGITGLSTQLCNCCADTQMALANGFAGVEQGANARQMANMQSIFGVQSALQECCCENRANIADLKYTVATENCADRTAAAENTQAILIALNSGVQSIKDQLCNDKIEQKNDIIAQLRSELMYARGQASQDVQTAAIQAGQRALANEVEQYVLPTPRPAYIVQNPNCCTQFNGCGCGSF